MKWMCLFCSIAVVCFGDVFGRKLTTVLNPDCQEQCGSELLHGFTNLVYVKSEGAQDTLHHLWSTVDKPSLLLLQTASNASLNFTWEMINDTAVPTITNVEDPLYVIALVFNKVWEYKDSQDSGSMGDSIEDVTATDTGTFSWQNVSETIKNSDQYSSATFKTKLNSTTEFFDETGLLSFKLEAQGGEGRSETIPRLLFTQDTSEVRFALEKAIPHTEKSRFALEISVFLNGPIPVDVDLFKLESVKSKDDEYTPGVFKSVHLVSESTSQKLPGSFLSWKPVAYTTEDLSVTDSTSTVYYTASKAEVHNESNSVAELFIKKHCPSYEGIMFNVSFGNTDDGFYTATNYTQWSFSYGLGIPGEDSLSSLVIIIIATGLGLPMCLIILSSVYLAWHRYKMQKDDLLLGNR